MQKYLMIMMVGMMAIAGAVLMASGEKGEPEQVPGAPLTVDERDDLLRGPCYWLYYYENVQWIWKAPHDAFGDISYAQRFTTCRHETLMAVDMYIYDDGSGLCGNDDVYCTIYDDVGGLPGTPLAQVTAPAGTYPFFPAPTTFDFSAFGLVLDCEFHVAFSSSALVGGGDYEICLSDDGSKPLRRSSSEWTPGVWVDMASGWGLDVNFLFEVYLCSPDDFENDHKMHYPQYPDIYGWDVFATDSLVLADDWLCTETGYIKDIHFWGSWKDDSIGEIDSFLLSIHRDIPAGVPGGRCFNIGDCNGDGIGLSVADMVELARYLAAFGSPAPFNPRYDMDGNCVIDDNDLITYQNYFIIGLAAFPGYPIPTCCLEAHSRPGDSLWQEIITDFNTIPFLDAGSEGWYEPDIDYLLENNHWNYFRYDVCLPESLWFWQYEDTIYWLNISAFVDDPDSTHWGWKSSYNHWNDDAVWAYNGEHDWQEMYEPGEYYYIPGDIDNDGDVDEDDLTYLQNFLFSAGPPPPYEVNGFYPAADVDGNCVIALADMVTLVGYLNGDGTPLLFCDLYPPKCGFGSFGAEFDGGGNLVNWWGANYYDSGWYYYPESEWHNIWFYDHPVDTTRKKTITIKVTMEAIDTEYPASIIFAVNWSTELWVSPPGDSMPPLPGHDEWLYIGRDVLFEGQVEDSIYVEFEYVLPDFNPEWVSIDVIASNARISGSMKHCCAKSMDLSFVITHGCDAPCDCIPGDANGDGIYNILDITYMITYGYGPGPPPTPYPLCSGDANCDCQFNILDITYMIGHLYFGGPAPCTCEQWLLNCGPPLRK